MSTGPRRRPWNDDEILDIIRDTLGEHHSRLSVSPLHLTAAHHVGDIGIDSLAATESAAQLEARLRIRLPDEQLAGISSIGELVVLIRKKLRAKGTNHLPP